MTFCKRHNRTENAKMPITIYRVDDKPSRTVKVREDFSVRRFHGTTSFLANVPAFFIQSGFFPFTPLSYLLLSLISFPPLSSSRLDFPMQRYSGRPVSKYRHANRSWICPAAFPNRRCPFSSLLLRLSGWVFREIPGCLLAFPVLSPLSGLHVKSLPPRKPKGSESREKKKASSTN